MRYIMNMHIFTLLPKYNLLSAYDVVGIVLEYEYSCKHKSKILASTELTINNINTWNIKAVIY